MITPGFFGFYNAHRSLLAAQNALSTINHNIANANTPGYSKQRVELSAYEAYAAPNPHQHLIGQVGQGPNVDAIIRIRDAFLDDQFRSANGILNMNTTTRDALQQIEGILAEPSTSGINTAMQNFFDAAQELSLHPESMAVRTDFVQQANDLITVFQQQALQLQDLRRNLVGDPLVGASLSTSQLAINAGDVNQILADLASLNKNIVTIQASGAQPNDLFDQRDKLLDDLSALVDINVTRYDNGQIDLAIGGQTMIRGVDQVDSLEVIANPTPPPGPPTPHYDDVPALVRTVNGGVVLNDNNGPEITSGKIKGIINMGGNDPTLSTVRGVLENLDTLLETVVGQINSLQQTGYDINGNYAPPDFFFNDPTLNPAQTLNIFHWRVNAPVSADPGLVAAAQDDPTVAGYAGPGTGTGYAGKGDGRNALSMAKLRDQTFGILGTTFTDYFNGVVSKLGIDTRSYENTSSSQQTQINSIDMRRQSTSGVNTDEEMIDMLRFQRMFEATSKAVTIFDDMYKTIINMV